MCFVHVGDNGACECSTVLSPDGPAGPVGESGDAGMTGEFGQEGDVGDPGPQGEDGLPVRIIKCLCLYHSKCLSLLLFF